MDRRKFIKSIEATAMMAALSSAFPTIGKAQGRSPAKDDREILEIYKYIDAHQADHLRRIQEFLRQPSISSTGEGMAACAEMVRRYFVELRFKEAELVKTPGHPVVWGYYDAGAETTLVNYGMYDVQPVEPLDKWSAPPFAAEIVDMPRLGKAIIARGANNTKGYLRAFLNAVESILAVKGALPINLMFLVEGEEEQGSPHLEAVVRQFQDRLKGSVGVFFAFGRQSEKSIPEIYLGSKGLVYFELECSNESRGIGPKKGSSSRFASVFGNPAWRLVEAIRTMVSRDGMDIAIDGLMEAVSYRPDELQLVDELLKVYDPAILLKEAEADRFYPGLSKRDVLIRYLLHPTFNINGMWSGYLGPNASTRLPESATCKIDARLVPEQKADNIIPLVRAHLDKRGFQDIQIRQLSGYDPPRSKLKSHVVQSLIRNYRAYSYEPTIWPSMAAANPLGVFSAPPLGLPWISGGLGHGGNNHAPNEYMVVEGKGRIPGLAQIEKFYVDYIYTIAGSMNEDQGRLTS
ncbi:MAG: M20/M25/M40 family metallo-hydrolase [Acidobacteria bacterium]|nr:M20/M25/M40 family metallo-hydrolase [Acidobacteriota bacterium]